jgi:hypothetical protein
MLFGVRSREAHSETFFNFYGVSFRVSFHNVNRTGESQTMATKKAVKKAAPKKAAAKKAAPKKAATKAPVKKAVKKAAKKA